MFADRRAFATARSGTRSKKSPALPRTSVRRDAVGDQAKPTRGDTLFLSVAIVRRYSRSYRSPAFTVRFEPAFHSSWAYTPTLGFVCDTTDAPIVCV